MSEQIGPTGDFPLGLIQEDDKGGLNVGIAVLEEDGLVVMEFGTMVTWIGGPAEFSLLNASMMRAKIQKHFGDLPYDASTFPLRIEVDYEKKVVISHMPRPTTTLVANPEFFLGWAEKLEAAVAKLEQGLV